MINKLGIIKNSSAIILGSEGGIGSAFVKIISDNNYFENIESFHRKSTLPFDITSESSIISISKYIKDLQPIPTLIINATGYLHDKEFMPEKSFKKINSDYLLKSFLINTLGPALLIKHLIPVFPRNQKCYFLNLSAKISSIKDNTLGGWYSYRATKTAANQIMKTTSIELERLKSKILCFSIHPGTVNTKLSYPFAKNNLNLLSPEQSVSKILSMLPKLTPDQNGCLIDYNGNIISF